MVQLEFVSRDEWGADPPQHAYHEIPLFQPRLILHHAAGAILPGDDSVSPADLKRIKGIQDYHQGRQGWNDIAYSWLTDSDGHLFEGRGQGVANGATFGYGSTSYAVCAMGHYDIQAADADLLEGLATIAAWGHFKGWWPLGYTHGHRDLGSTSCPGKNLYSKIGFINRRAEEIFMATYRKVEDMPTNSDGTITAWAKEVVDDGIAAGAIKIDDKHTDSWEAPVTYGTLWTNLDRLGWPKGTRK